MQNKVSDQVSHGEGERIAKRMARVGLCSRRDAERWIEEGRVKVNGRVLSSPAHNVKPSDRVEVDGQPLPSAEPTRAWLYHKPRGLVTSHADPEGRPTVFQSLSDDLPRVISVGRLDINTEGLLILTNDGGLARILELPSTGWMRRYRVRAFGQLTEDNIRELARGMTIEGVSYGPIEVKVDRASKENIWLTLGLREGKNREIKKVLGAFDLKVSRLIRVSYGPFMLGDLKEGEAKEVRPRILKDQLGERLIREANLHFPDGREATEQRIRGKKLEVKGEEKPAPRRARPGSSEKPSGGPRKPDAKRAKMATGGRPRFDKSKGESVGKAGKGEKPFGDKPRADKPRGGKPFGDKPRGDKPGGGKPPGQRARGPNTGKVGMKPGGNRRAPR